MKAPYLILSPTEDFNREELSLIATKLKREKSMVNTSQNLILKLMTRSLLGKRDASTTQTI